MWLRLKRCSRGYAVWWNNILNETDRNEASVYGGVWPFGQHASSLMSSLWNHRIELIRGKWGKSLVTMMKVLSLAVWFLLCTFWNTSDIRSALSLSVDVSSGFALTNEMSGIAITWARIYELTESHLVGKISYLPFRLHVVTMKCLFKFREQELV